MSISSIDLATVAPRSAETSAIVGKEQHQLQHMSENGAVNFEHNVEQKGQKAQETKKSEGEQYSLDGSGSQKYQGNKKKKKKEESSEAPMAPRSNSSFDIMI